MLTNEENIKIPINKLFYINISYSYSKEYGIKINTNTEFDINLLEQYELELMQNYVSNKMDNIIDKTIDEKRKFTLEEKVIIEVCLKLYKILNSKINQPRHLYLLYSKSINCLKIGITNNLEKRIKDISNDMNLKDIQLLSFKPKKAYLESSLHSKFSHLNKKIKGKHVKEHREWFEYSDEIINHFKTL